MKKLAALFALLSLAVARVGVAAEGLDAELLPPEFLFTQRDALGLSDAQLQAIKEAMERARGDFEKHKAQVDERAHALKEILRQPDPDVAQVEEKLRALLIKETDVKLL